MRSGAAPSHNPGAPAARPLIERPGHTRNPPALSRERTATGAVTRHIIEQILRYSLAVPPSAPAAELPSDTAGVIPTRGDDSSAVSKAGRSPAAAPAAHKCRSVHGHSVETPRAGTVPALEFPPRPWRKYAECHV